ncbi:penicillin-binding protein 1C [Candidatus Magnetaquiglobus chichijimensis]|uniref:penicillin-binding protein 1C n=1 Tax=Candidatus Magnetaquiglobus chichijimensis TaxID=3141448 RepID=UPI003B96CA6A
MNPRRGGGLRGVVIGVVGVLLIGLLLERGLLDLPDAPEVPEFQTVRAAHASSDVWLLDREGRPLQPIRVDHARRRLNWTPLEEIAPNLVEILVRVEDRAFHQHRGVSWLSVLGAIKDRLLHGSRRGASTLTMQLVGLLERGSGGWSGRRGLRQKWLQMRAAWAMERSWSKAEILEAYLNLVPFRGELQGIAAASRSLFDKAPSGLLPAESILLVAQLPAPNGPVVRTTARACALAARIDPEISCPELTTRAERLLRGRLPPVRAEVALAPHAARWLIRGRGPEIGSSAGLRSTLDADLQRSASESLDRQLAQLAGHNVRDGAVLVVENATGAVLAYVGGGGVDPSARHVDGVRALRQAGSTLKPFLYQLAIEERLITAASLLEDSPVELVMPTGIYQPNNYDREFRGWVSARTALASSLNVPAVRVLMVTGLAPFAARLRQFGYYVREEGSFHGHALALGSVEVTLWQQVNAYATLANGGLFVPLVLESDRQPPAPRRITSAESAFILADILSDPLARTPTFGLGNPLATPFWSAVKTGTSKRMRDNWCIGFTPRFTVGVWVGNFDGQPMREVSGISGAAEVWLEVMLAARHRFGSGGDDPELPPGADMIHRSILFEPAVEPPRREWFLTGTGSDTIRLHDGALRPSRIRSPGDGAILAMDPDIPPGLQRLVPRMSPVHPGNQWRLDGVPWPAVPEGWELVPGSHQWELLDGEGRLLDRARFQVRGATRHVERE